MSGTVNDAVNVAESFAEWIETPLVVVSVRMLTEITVETRMTGVAKRGSAGALG